MATQEERLAAIEKKLDDILDRLPQATSHDNAIAIHQARGGNMRDYLKGLNEQKKSKSRRTVK